MPHPASGLPHWNRRRGMAAVVPPRPAKVAQTGQFGEFEPVRAQAGGLIVRPADKWCLYWVHLAQLTEPFLALGDADQHHG
jgi:hypothetical protein